MFSGFRTGAAVQLTGDSLVEPKGRATVSHRIQSRQTLGAFKLNPVLCGESSRLTKDCPLSGWSEWDAGSRREARKLPTMHQARDLSGRAWRAICFRQVGCNHYASNTPYGVPRYCVGTSVGTATLIMHPEWFHDPADGQEALSYSVSSVDSRGGRRSPGRVTSDRLRRDA